MIGHPAAHFGLLWNVRRKFRGRPSKRNRTWSPAQARWFPRNRHSSLTTLSGTTGPSPLLNSSGWHAATEINPQLKIRNLSLNSRTDCGCKLGLALAQIQRSIKNMNDKLLTILKYLNVCRCGGPVKQITGDKTCKVKVRKSQQVSLSWNDTWQNVFLCQLELGTGIYCGREATAELLRLIGAGLSQVIITNRAALHASTQDPRGWSDNTEHTPHASHRS